MSGNWKAICKTRDLFQNGYSHGTWIADLKGYSVKSGYDWIRLKETKVGWSKLVWNNAALPKHCFVNWLNIRNALNTKEKLHRIGVSPDDLCCICHAGSENVTHLFQHCPYVIEILELICAWLKIPKPQGNSLIWTGMRNWSQVQKAICLAVFMAVNYIVWQQRNFARLEGVLIRPAVVFNQCKTLMKIRIRCQLSKVVRANDRDWINCILN
ncbi:uncharacterized protein LOC141627912 [Silene latifolia]|uniref:uncharacterized protein LOC141627912 n=1 Tax=Silene latifolia TaxID=37657 RepID=UPI003D782401